MRQKLGVVVQTTPRFCLTTDSRHDYPVADHILARQFDVDAPNPVGGTDITYLWTQAGWLYLALVIDLFSRRAN